jgi:flavin-binding protein dodecin
MSERKRVLMREDSMAERAAESVYRIVDVAGESDISWEDAGRRAVESAASSIRDLRVDRGRGQKQSKSGGHERGPYCLAHVILQTELIFGNPQPGPIGNPSIPAGRHGRSAVNISSFANGALGEHRVTTAYSAARRWRAAATPLAGKSLSRRGGRLCPPWRARAAQRVLPADRASWLLSQPVDGGDPRRFRGP